MGLRINTNIAAQTAMRGLESAGNRMAGNFRRLATGLKISSAADDAAGLAISERLRAQVRSVDQARRNAADGISLVQTGEGALNEVSNILTRLRELAIQSANGTVSSIDRSTLNDEFHSLVDEVDRIAQATEFNGIKLLNGNPDPITLHIGPDTNSHDYMLAPLADARAGGMRLNVASLDTLSKSTLAVSVVDEAIESISLARGRFGAMHNRLESTIRSLGMRGENLTAAESRIRDVDVARETAALAKNQILQQATISMLAQANAQPQLALRLLG